MRAAPRSRIDVPAPPVAAGGRCRGVAAVLLALAAAGSLPAGAVAQSLQFLGPQGSPGSGLGPSPTPGGGAIPAPAPTPAPAPAVGLGPALEPLPGPPPGLIPNAPAPPPPAAPATPALAPVAPGSLFGAPPNAPRPAFPAPGGGFGSTRGEPHAVLPQAPPGKSALGLFAKFGSEGAPIPRNLVWRVFADQPEATGAFPLVAESAEATPVFMLNPGGYIVHVTYGLASMAQRVQVGPVSRREAFALPAGGLRLGGDVENKPIAATKLTFDIFEGSFLQGRTSSQPYYRGASAGEVVLLPEGTYHVVSTYGDANAVMRADVNVVPGKLTDATMHHRAAEVTLKLVRQKGAEAQADTQWTVITPGGDTIKESIGAVPVFVLSEGDYTAIARNDGRNYSTDFKVEPGRNQEVEVLLK